MKLNEFHYDLPEELIAQFPLAERVASRLLCLNGAQGELRHRVFSDLPQMLDERDLLVFNDTRVIPARLWGRKETGGRVEILIERLTGEATALAHIRSSKSPRPGTELLLTEAPDSARVAHRLRVTGRDGDLFCLQLEAPGSMAAILAEIGHMPLPPYIAREDLAADRERYQTVYADKSGAVAAPTAGLHFDNALLAELAARGIRSARVTLHVGAGTFQPVRVEDITQHQMHAEYIEVGESVCEAVRRTRELGGRVVAVGTTSVRSLESAASGGELMPFRGDSDIFIYPGYRFRCVDAMITNFHLPESTLLMLVSAFAGREPIMKAYREAIRERYRFFSYGDAMFITPGPTADLAS